MERHPEKTIQKSSTNNVQKCESKGKEMSWTSFLMTSVPPGQKYLEMHHVINFFKGFTSIYVILLMVIFQNFNNTAFIYLGLHGTYGIVWLIKEKITPDLKWRQKVTFVSGFGCISLFLTLYWISPYLIISNFVETPGFKISFALMLHTIGIVLMMASDTQKYFMKQYNVSLITNGWFARSRNINYLGEMMIYFTYALLGNSFVPYIILGCIWYFFFYQNMLDKDERLRYKKGGIEYIDKTNLLLPF